MKKKIITVCAAVLFLTALGLTLYPLISNYVNQKYASEIQTAYGIFALTCAEIAAVSITDIKSVNTSPFALAW